MGNEEGIWVGSEEGILMGKASTMLTRPDAAKTTKILAIPIAINAVIISVSYLFVIRYNLLWILYNTSLSYDIIINTTY